MREERKKKKVVVTGGAGFIGSHLVDLLLSQGNEVTVVDNFSTGRPENLLHQSRCAHLRVIEADITDLDKIQSCFEGSEAVFHLAALADIVPSIVDPCKYYHANVTGTLCVAEACRLSGVKKLIYSASSSCYGIPKRYPTNEEAPIDTQYPYALTKFLGERIVLHWGRVYKIPVVSLRLFNVYGPRSRTSGTYGAVFGVFLAQKLAGKPFTVVGDGSQKRDFIHVSDVVRAFEAAASCDLSDEIFNVGSGKPQSVNTLVELLKGEKINIPKRPGEPDCTWADIKKITHHLHWKPQMSFQDGVRDVLEHIDYWKNAPVWTPESIHEATKEWFKYLKRTDHYDR